MIGTATDRHVLSRYRSGQDDSFASSSDEDEMVEGLEDEDDDGEDLYMAV